jgi:two-component system copper resistance phosphate regulon response regulator CusR
MQLLIAEDERRVLDFISRGLEEEGFLVHQASTGEAALALLTAESFDLALLDWMLPGHSGFEVLQALRARGDPTPVMMLTARDAVADRALALNAGADDYLVKPFAFEELLARIRAVLRRAGGRAHPQLRYEDLVLDPAMRRVTRAGHELRLTVKEYALLQFLLENAGRVVSRTRILEAVWEQELENYSNVVEVYIRYLRAKVDAPFPVKLIQTVRGVGYSLRKES